MSKLALLIGINYIGQSSQLSGCINDMFSWFYYLTEKRGYEDENITLLIEKDATAQAMMHSFEEIIKRSHDPEVQEVFICYSGHGTQVRDSSGDEKDGKDECLVPVDYLRNGVIVDDDLTDYFLHMSPKVNCYFIVDACHSGTMLDKVPRNITLVSGCRDDQTSADIQAGDRSCGAFTSELVKTLREGRSIDEETIAKVRVALRAHGFSQVPVLTSNNIIL